MLECSNSDCKHRWFHYSCVGAKATEGEWFCSRRCETSGGSSHCICRMKCDEALIQYEAGEGCTGVQFYHPSCVGQMRQGIFLLNRCTTNALKMRRRQNKLFREKIPIQISYKQVMVLVKKD